MQLPCQHSNGTPEARSLEFLVGLPGIFRVQVTTLRQTFAALAAMHGIHDQRVPYCGSRRRVARPLH
jgi:hypothetical protein